jgi:RNase H-fold protein (predicted Holliday junction resolvase)
MQNTEEQILTRIKKAMGVLLFFADNFASFGNTKTVNKALERLVKSGEIDRVATGIYVRPKVSKTVGKMSPTIEEIAQAIAKRDKAKIVPTGSYALNQLGLSAQVPMNVVYLTVGSARNVKVGKMLIKFKKTTPRNVSAVGEISRLVIQALRTLGKDNATSEEIAHIQKLLAMEKPTLLEHDIRLAPAWIREIMKPALKQKVNE